MFSFTNLSDTSAIVTLFVRPTLTLSVVLSRDRFPDTGWPFVNVGKCFPGTMSRGGLTMVLRYMA